MSRPRTPEEARAFLASRSPSTIVLGLDRMRRALAELGNPEERVPAVQVAGTNGKGSTCALLDAMLRAGGWRSALYTSPHLITVHERIRVAGRAIDDALLGLRILEVLDRSPTAATALTYFELVTLVAFWHLAEEGVQIAVLETGLGGRLDAVTCCWARVTAVTPLSMDHMEFLGHTLREIAGEKAGIFRPGVPVISAAQPGEAAAVLAAHADALAAPLEVEGRDFALEAADGGLRFRHGARTLSGIRLGLHGTHQRQNAAVALATVDRLAAQFPVSDADRRTGLASVQWPGRLELRGGTPELLLDGAHNPGGAAALRSALDEEFAGRAVHLVFGVVGEKQLLPMLEQLLPRCASVHLTPLETPRSLDPARYLALARPFCPDVSVHRGPAEALASARNRAGLKDLILVAGSLYLVGAVTHLLEGEPPLAAP